MTGDPVGIAAGNRHAGEMRVARAGIVEVGGSLAVKSLVLLQIAVVARLYGLDVFGAFGTAMLCIGAVSALTALRLDQYLISAPDQELDAELDAAFTLSLISGVAGVLLAVLLGGAFAFSGKPELALQLVILSPVLLSAAFSLPCTLLERELRFAVTKLAPIVGTVLFVVVATGMRYFHAPAIEGLLMAQLAYAGAAASVIWWASPRRPRIRLNSNVVSAQLSYSRPLVVAGTATFIAGSGDDLLVRYFRGESALAIYLIAFHVPAYLAAISEMIARVGLPVLRHHQHSRRELNRAYTTLAQCIAVITVPLGFAVALFADDLVLIAYGSAWSEAAPYLRLFAIAFVLRASTGMHWQLLAVLFRRSRYLMWAALGSAGFMVVVAPPLIYAYGMLGGAVYSFVQLAILGPVIRFPLVRNVLGDLSYLRTAVSPLLGGIASCAAVALLWRATGTHGFGLASVSAFAGTYVAVLVVREPGFVRRAIDLGVAGWGSKLQPEVEIGT